jgi:hypothetical protein
VSCGKVFYVEKQNLTSHVQSSLWKSYQGRSSDSSKARRACATRAWKETQQMIADLSPAHSWQDVVLIAITTLPAVIAALSSLRNGHILKNGTVPDPKKAGQKVATSSAKKATSKNGQQPDWYRPPKL